MSKNILIYNNLLGIITKKFFCNNFHNCIEEYIIHNNVYNEIIKYTNKFNIAVTKPLDFHTEEGVTNTDTIDTYSYTMKYIDLVYINKAPFYFKNCVSYNLSSIRKNLGILFGIILFNCCYIPRDAEFAVSVDEKLYILDFGLFIKTEKLSISEIEWYFFESGIDFKNIDFKSGLVEAWKLCKNKTGINWYIKELLEIDE